MRDRRCWFGHKWAEWVHLRSQSVYQYQSSNRPYKVVETFVTKCTVCGEPRIKKVDA